MLQFEIATFLQNLDRKLELWRSHRFGTYILLIFVVGELTRIRASLQFANER